MGQPDIKRVAPKIAALERRAERLSQNIESGNGSRKALDYDRAELGALEAAIEALRWHRVAKGELDSPLSVLVELLGAVEDVRERGHTDVEAQKALEAEMIRAKDVITAWTQGVNEEVLASDAQPG